MNTSNTNTSTTTFPQTEIVCVSSTLLYLFIGVAIAYNVIILSYFAYKIYKYKQRIKIILKSSKNANRKRIEPTEAFVDDAEETQNNKTKFSTIELT